MQNNELDRKEKQTSTSSALPKSGLQLGYFVFSTLTGIKIIEYVLSKTVAVGNWPYLLLLALISAWLILYFYKHIYQLWRSRGKSDE